VMYFQPDLFDAAGLNYPPQTYGAQYVLDSTPVDWTWATVGEVAKRLTIDAEGDNYLDGVDFDPTNIVQYGYSPVWESHPAYYGAFFTAGTMVQGTPGAYSAVAPDAWKASWQWIYDGIWGTQPFIPNGAVSGSPDFGSGNTFASGKIGMAVLPNWYLCCLGDMVTAGYEFQLAALPSYNGAVHGRIDADTFRVWNGSDHIEEAVEFYEYLVTVGVDKLIIGTPVAAPAYGALSAITAKQQPFVDARTAQYPFLTVASWDIMLAGQSFPDIPSAEGYMPNFNSAWSRLGTFGDLMNNTDGLDLNAEIATLQADLTTIFNNP